MSGPQGSDPTWTWEPGQGGGADQPPPGSEDQTTQTEAHRQPAGGPGPSPAPSYAPSGTAEYRPPTSDFRQPQPPTGPFGQPGQHGAPPDQYSRPPTFSQQSTQYGPQPRHYGAQPAGPGPYPPPGQRQPGQYGPPPGQYSRPPDVAQQPPQYGPPGQYGQFQPYMGSPVRRGRKPILIGAGIAALIVAVVLILGFWLPGFFITKQLDVNKAQAGVQHILTDPTIGYGAKNVSDVKCNNGQDPVVRKGGTFNCDVNIGGTKRQVTVKFVDDNGTYQVSRPK